MGTNMIILLAGGAIVLLIVISIYNRLVKLKNNRINAFADIDVQLKQRYDLVPQLVESVKGYMKHESGVLTDITNARAQALKASTINEKIAAENQLTRAMTGFNVAVEAYPDLKANQNFLHLQQEISDLENKLAASRRFFNSATKEYNSSRETFPSIIFAGIFGFGKETMFDVGDMRGKMEETPKISFN